jgi:hypothetical protein
VFDESTDIAVILSNTFYPKSDAESSSTTSNQVTTPILPGRLTTGSYLPKGSRKSAFECQRNSVKNIISGCGVAANARPSQTRCLPQSSKKAAHKTFAQRPHIRQNLGNVECPPVSDIGVLLQRGEHSIPSDGKSKQLFCRPSGKSFATLQALRTDYVFTEWIALAIVRLRCAPN